MDQVLFYCFLNDHKKSANAFIQNLLSFPKKLGVLFVITFLSGFLGFVSILLKRSYLAIIAILIEFLCYIILDYFIENFKISNSNKQLKEYINSCIYFKEWLKSYDVVNYNFIKEINNRLEKRINNLKKSQNEFYERLYKVAQTFLMPIIIAIITYLINQPYTITEKIINVISILFISLILFLFSKSLIMFYYFPKKRAIEQMIYFSENLQNESIVKNLAHNSN